MIEESPELVAVMRRLLEAVQAGDVSTVRSMVRPFDDLLILGSAPEEWTNGENALGLLLTQVAGTADFRYEFEKLVGYETGKTGWAACELTAVFDQKHRIPLRMVAVFHIEEGAWRVVLWHVSEPRPNDPEILGVDLTESLRSLVDAINQGSDVSVDDNDLPTSTVTIVFTDVEGSTSRAFDIGDVAWGQLVTRHFQDMERIADANGGVLVKTLGDGAMLAFNSVSGGLRAAAEIQGSIETLANGDVTIRVGVHTGDALRSGGDYLGKAVDKAARVAAAAIPGQTLVTDAARVLLEGSEEFQFGETIILELRGIPGTTIAYPLAVG